MAKGETAGGKCSVNGIGRYRRAVDLPKLIALWPHEIEDRSAAGRARLLAKLKAALRAERLRGLAGHWTYDLARHAQLLAAYRAELAEDAAMRENPAERWDANGLQATNKKGPALRRSRRHSNG